MHSKLESRTIEGFFYTHHFFKGNAVGETPTTIFF
jgi:hypothetical protein